MTVVQFCYQSAKGYEKSYSQGRDKFKYSYRVNGFWWHLEYCEPPIFQAFNFHDFHECSVKYEL
jgi:hypothetical protein